MATVRLGENVIEGITSEFHAIGELAFKVNLGLFSFIEDGRVFTYLVESFRTVESR